MDGHWFTLMGFLETALLNARHYKEVMGLLKNLIVGGFAGGAIRYENARREFEERDPVRAGFPPLGGGGYLGDPQRMGEDALHWSTMGSNFRRGSAFDFVGFFQIFCGPYRRSQNPQVDQRFTRHLSEVAQGVFGVSSQIVGS